MKRAGWVVCLLVLSLGVWASAQTDCGCGSAAEPSCYIAFRSIDLIGIDVVVPGEYFSYYSTFETPLITSWQVETLDGQLVRSEAFASPKGHQESYVWDLTTNGGVRVSEGFYRIIVYTSSTPPIESYVKIVNCCCSSCWGWGCCPTLCSCYWPEICRGGCADPYLVLTTAGTRSCCGLRVTIHGTFESTP